MRRNYLISFMPMTLEKNKENKIICGNVKSARRFLLFLFKINLFTDFVILFFKLEIIIKESKIC
jgi:hypothetical protein